MHDIRVGISGWTYGPWRNTFYPKGLPIHRQLEYASRQLGSIEINGSFYRMQRPETYLKWYEETPDDFVFSIKASRFITHVKRLGDVEKPMANFFASGILRLQEKLGAILWQLPPSLKYDRERVENFLELLPRDTREAAELARGHDPWMDDRSYFEVDRRRKLRHALEVRNPTFENPEFVRLLKRKHVALVVADAPMKWPYFEERTADFAYIRLHGEKELYVSGYDDPALERWAKKIRAWVRGNRGSRGSNGRDVFVYFDNDAKVRAPFDAMSLMRKLGLKSATELRKAA